jgi:hypothetical protein
MRSARTLARRTPAALAALAVGCTVDRPPTASPRDDGAAAPAAALAAPDVVAAASVRPPFFFLAPIGTEQSVGTFDGARAPVAEVCRWSGAACQLPLVASYTTSPGADGRAIAVDAAARAYRVDWPTAGLPAGSVYRVRVTLGGTELGAALAKVPAAGESATTVRAAGYVALGNSSVLPVRFRIEAGEAELAGTPTASASTMIPDREFVPRVQDYSDTHPRLPGIAVSFNTLMVAFQGATTVAQANALLRPLGAAVLGGIPGSAAAPGILAVRLPATSHAQMEQALATLRASPYVRVAVQDVPLSADAIPGPNGGTPGDWTWELGPSGGNWGLELVRAPQMWNLNAAICKRLRQAHPAGDCSDPRTFPAVPLTGVLDAGFNEEHEDLRLKRNFSPGVHDSHGAAVVSVIGAIHGNGKGIDGVNPFASVALQANTFWFWKSTPVLIEKRASIMSMLEAYFRFVLAIDRPRVVNLSSGYNWLYRVNARTNVDAQSIANEHGKLFAALQHVLIVGTQRPLPIVVAAAGNDSDQGLGRQDARYNSPWANAGLVQGQSNVIVVEGLANDPGAAGGASRSSSSNDHGHVSAPGFDVATAHDPGASAYTLKRGTSFATALVSGLVGYLYTLAPDLPWPTPASNPVRELLRSPAVAIAVGDPGAGAAKRVDAFAAALAIDQMAGQPADRVLRMLLDIDDGTPDGNERVKADGSVNVSEDADGDAGPGDGVIDMSDFRRFRDWLLQATGHPNLALDGAPNHPKKDLNGDREVGTFVDENVYPRGDFNGDGILDQNLKAKVPGFANPVTDFEVFQKLYNGDMPARELPTLLNSTDLGIDASQCMAAIGARTVTSRILLGNHRSWDSQFHLRAGRPPAAEHVYSLPPGADGHTAIVVLDGTVASADGPVPTDAVAFRQVTAAELRPGADLHWKAACTPGIFVRLTYRPSMRSRAYPHLTGPLETGGRFHISINGCGPGPWEWGRGHTVSPPFAYLDLNDLTCASGDLRILRQVGGAYRYYLHETDYSTNNTSRVLGESGAFVQVYRGGQLVAQFAVPPQPGDLWTVFEMNGTTITPINTMRFEPNLANVDAGMAPTAAVVGAARRAPRD